MLRPGDFRAPEFRGQLCLLVCSHLSEPGEFCWGSAVASIHFPLVSFRHVKTVLGEIPWDANYEDPGPHNTKGIDHGTRGPEDQRKKHEIKYPPF